MAKVELKQPVVDEIKAMLDGAVGAVVVDYRGLTVEQDTKLRKQLREAGVSYKVYKNTLIKRAAEGTEFAALDPHLEGPTALAVSKDDATAPARILAEFAKTAPKLELKASVVEGTYYDQAGTQVIATIPSREVLLGKLLGSRPRRIRRRISPPSPVCGSIWMMWWQRPRNKGVWRRCSTGGGNCRRSSPPTSICAPLGSGWH